jgi:hypothetical protein
MARVCEQLAQGKSLRSICQGPEMPNIATVMRWVDEDDTLRAQYAHARERGIDAMAEATLDIADDLTEDANSRRVRIDARKWFASKLLPKKYGDKLDVEHAGNVTVILAPIGDDRNADPPSS